MAESYEPGNIVKIGSLLDIWIRKTGEIIEQNEDQKVTNANRKQFQTISTGPGSIYNGWDVSRSR